MSGDVQPRKRKDKRKKKDEEVEFLQHHGSIGGSDEVIHVYKESKLGGNICSKIVFFGLLGAIGVMVGLIIFEFHGTNDVDTQSAANSPWSMMLEGWVDSSSGHDDHDEHTEHGGVQDEHDEHSEHDDEHEDHKDEHDKQHEGEYFEGGEHEHEEEEEPIEEVEEVSFVQQTYDDLRAAYNQITPEESEAELTEDTSAQLNDYEATESEPEPSETEEEEDDEEPQEDDPLGQWKSESGPELLAEGLDEVQTEEGTDEEETEEESEDEASAAQDSGGPKSTEADEDQIIQDFVSDEAVEPTEKFNEPESKEELYENSDITNQADWEFREDLDEADRQLDEGEDFQL